MPQVQTRLRAGNGHEQRAHARQGAAGEDARSLATLVRFLGLTRADLEEAAKRKVERTPPWEEA